MNSLQAFILGLVQGLAEYLPISSSGHLAIMKDLLGLDMSGADSLEFDIVLHVATVLSTIVILWREFLPLCRSFFTLKNDSNTMYVLKILLSCIPIAVVGIVFKDTIELLFADNMLTVGICLIMTAILLAFTYFYRTNKDTAMKYQPRDITWLDAFVIGCSQALAVLPGLSRSGTTIATGIMIGDKREKVAQFSFFMVVIPILGEALLDLKDIIGGEGAAAAGSTGFVQLLIGFVTAFVVGCLACKWMLEIVKKGKLVWFAVYCLVVGVICLIFQ